MKESVRRHRPHLWERNHEGDRSFLLHQDNAPCHVSAFTLGKLGEWGIQLLAHPPYSPDLAPCDFDLFPKMKEILHGRHFRTLLELQTEAKRVLNSFSDDFYEQIFADLVTRWKKCISADGDYFEGAHVSVPPEHLGDTDSEVDSPPDSSEDEGNAQ